MHSSRRVDAHADAHGTRHGNKKRHRNGGKRMGNAERGLGCKLKKCKALLNIYAWLCIAIHRRQRA